jgi:hypothetical protein
MKCKKCNTEVVICVSFTAMWAECKVPGCGWGTNGVLVSPPNAYNALSDGVESAQRQEVVDSDWKVIRELAGNEEKNLYMRSLAKAVLWLRDKERS